VDNTTGDDFRFDFTREQLIRFASTPNKVTNKAMPAELAREMIETLVSDGEPTGWEWQGDLMDWWINEFITAILKARQLGVTWCAAGVGLWYITMIPGTRVLCQSIGEEEAEDIIDHAWEMYLSLLANHPHLVGHLKLTRPTNGRRPSLEIEFQHPNGKASKFNAMTSTTAKGHGRTAAFVIMDEFARHPYARESYKAMVPTQAGSKKASGRTAIISTGNGVSTDEEAGNFFHYLWTHSKHYGLESQFLRWDANPDRDEEWYQRVAMKLPERDRGEQYPRNEREAFILTGDPYFDQTDLVHYEQNLRKPKWSFTWEPIGATRKARQRKSKWGICDVLEPPVSTHEYAIGCDIATGYGRDFSAAYVVDLGSGALVAEMVEKTDAETFAEQLHFLGKWYGTASSCRVDALIAVEKGGGWGEAVITPLRDGKNNRPPYKRLYRHTQDMSVNAAEQSRSFGFPISSGTRNHVIQNMQKMLRERSLPFMTAGLLGECHTFVTRNKAPSPAAADGANDDRVMACCLALEMFRRFGSHPDARPKRRERQYLAPYPWSD